MKELRILFTRDRKLIINNWSRRTSITRSGNNSINKLSRVTNEVLTCFTGRTVFVTISAVTWRATTATASMTTTITTTPTS